MRLTVLCLSLAGCANHANPSAQPPTPRSDLAHPGTGRPPTGSNASPRTHFDGGDFTLDLPGQWVEHPIAGAHELRMGDHDQIIVSVLAPIQGLDVVASAARLTEIQQQGFASQCKLPSKPETPTAAPAPPGAVRFHAACPSPPVIATFVAAPLGSSVLSYEHYRYDERAPSPEFDRADEAILATLQLNGR